MATTAAGSRQITGRMLLFVNGTRMPVKGSAKIKNPLGYKRNPEMVEGQTYFTKEEVPCEVEATLVMLEGMKASEIAAIEGATLMIQSDTNKRWYTVANAACTGEVEDGGADGVSMTFFGDPAKEETGG